MARTTRIKDKIKEGKELTVQEKVINMAGTEVKGYFVMWYCKQPEDQENFETYSKTFLKNAKYNNCMNWLVDENVQKAIKWYMKLLYVQDMIKLYKSMYKQAIKGNVNSANWCVKFAESDFFKNKENEMEEYLNGVDIGDDDEDEEENS